MGPAVTGTTGPRPSLRRQRDVGSAPDHPGASRAPSCNCYRATLGWHRSRGSGRRQGGPAPWLAGSHMSHTRHPVLQGDGRTPPARFRTCALRVVFGSWLDPASRGSSGDSPCTGCHASRGCSCSAQSAPVGTFLHSPYSSSRRVMVLSDSGEGLCAQCDTASCRTDTGWPFRHGTASLAGTPRSVELLGNSCRCGRLRDSRHAHYSMHGVRTPHST